MGCYISTNNDEDNQQKIQYKIQHEIQLVKQDETIYKYIYSWIINNNKIPQGFASAKAPALQIHMEEIIENKIEDEKLDDKKDIKLLEEYNMLGSPT